MIFTISRGQCLVNDLPPCYCFVSVRVTLYLLPVCVTSRLVLLCDMISCSHSMYNAYPKLYVTCLSAFFPPLQPRVSRHSNARALALECFIWLHIRPISARFMTSGVGLFHQIPRQDTIHGCCVMPALFLNLRGAALQACQGSCKKKPSIFSAARLLFIPFYIHQLKKRKKAPGNFYYTLPQLHHRHKTAHI